MKRFWAISFLLFCLVTCLTACGGRGKQLAPIDADDVAVVTATDALYSSYLYVIEDKDAIAELASVYNSIRYEPLSEEEDPEIFMDTLYYLNFAKSYDRSTIGESIAGVGISPKGYVFLTDGQTYQLTFSFDEARLKALLEEYDITPDPGTIE